MGTATRGAFAALAFGWLTAACAPPAAIDRNQPTNAALANADAAPAPITPSSVPGGDEDVAAPVASDAATDALPIEAAPDAAVAADASATPDTAALVDSAVEAAPSPPDVGPVDVAPVVRRALLVVGPPPAPVAGDLVVRRRLEALGYTVTVASDTAVAGDATGIAIIVISASCRGSVLLGTFRDVAVPVVTLKATVLDDMDMTRPERAVDYDEEYAVDLALLDDRHPLAAGLHGTVRAVGVAAAMTWGRPGPSALRIASFLGQPDKIALFAYEKGATMITRPAQARRVSLFATDRAAERWTAEGLRLFDAAIAWATAR